MRSRALASRRWSGLRKFSPLPVAMAAATLPAPAASPAAKTPGYRALNPRAVTGTDGVTWEAYGRELEGNLEDLLGRVHRGGYRAKPARRAWIPKSDGRQRPLGIAVLEDKILQRAVVEVLNGIHEADFLAFCYGFRSGRSAHDALATGIYDRKVNWVLDADIRDFFGSLDHGWLMRFLEHRVTDRRVLRLIQKWLRAGVVENGDMVTD